MTILVSYTAPDVANSHTPSYASGTRLVYTGIAVNSA